MEETSKNNETAQLDIGAVRYQLAISALEAIVDPIGHMRKHLKEDERLDESKLQKVNDGDDFETHYIGE